MDTLRNGLIWNIMFCGIIVLLLIVTIINQDETFIKSGISGIAVSSTIISFFDAICSYLDYKKLSCENDKDIKDYYDITQEIETLTDEIIQETEEQIRELNVYIHDTFDSSICKHYEEGTLAQNEKEFILEKSAPPMRELLESIFNRKEDPEIQEFVDFNPTEARKEIYDIQQSYINRKENQKRILNYLYPLSIFIFIIFILIRQVINSHIQDVLTVLAFLGLFINILIQNYCIQKFNQYND